MAGTYPALEVSFAPGVASSDVPSGGDWVDLSTDVAYLTTVAGRDDEYTQPSAGQLDLGLDNSTGKFDPDNTTGPYYGNLLPLTWFRVLGGGASASSDVFYGQVSIEGFQVTASPFPSLVTVEVLDMTEQLANTDLPGSVYELEVEADAPDAWWRLNESSGSTATDSSGNDHHGEVTDGATFNSRTGLIEGDEDGALLIDPGRLTLPPGQQVRSDWDFSVEGWIDVPDEVAYDGTIWRQSNHGELVPAGAVSSIFVGFKAVANEAWPYIEILVNGAAAADGAWRLGAAALSPGRHYIAAYIPPLGAAVPGGLNLYVDGLSTSGTTGGALGTLPAFPTMLYTDAGSDATLDEIAVYDGELVAGRVLAHYEAGTTPWAGELTNQRVEHLLDAIDFPASLRTVADGASTLQSATLHTDAWSALLDVAKAERGEVYIDHADGGKVRFRGRHDRWTATESVTSQATFGDGGGAEVPYAELDIQDDRIINRAIIQRRNGGALTASDAASEAQYQRRTLSESGLLYEDDAESSARASLAVAEKKDRHRRVRRITLEPLADTDLAWAQVFARKIGDRITVKWRPLYGGTNSYECWIEGIRHSYDARVGVLRTTFSLSPVPYGATAEPYFIVGTSTVSGPARIGY